MVRIDKLQKNTVYVFSTRYDLILDKDDNTPHYYQGEFKDYDENKKIITFNKFFDTETGNLKNSSQKKIKYFTKYCVNIDQKENNDMNGGKKKSKKSNKSRKSRKSRKSKK